MTALEFVEKIQEYYQKAYNATQAGALAVWFRKRSPRFVAALYDELIENFDGRFNLPLIKDLNAAATRLLDAYPELRNTYIPATDALQITDGSEVDYREEVAGLLGKLANDLAYRGE